MKIGILVALFLQSLNFVCQNETKNWYFGNGAGISFSGTSVSTLTNGVLTSSLGCASISDPSGNLLFYTDGVTIWNQTHAVMANGTGLFGNNSAQSSVIVKKPGSTTLYYVFTVQGGGGSAGLNYSIVDMSLSSGQGSVTVKNFSLLSGPIEEKINAVKHCNGNDVWIVTLSGSFQSRLLSSTGVSTTAVISSGQGGTNVLLSQGSLKLSPNGKKLGLCINSTTSILGNYSCKVLLYDFDNSTGTISNPITLQSYSNAAFLMFYGCEFSADGSKFYITSTNYIGQYDLCGSSPPSPGTMFGLSDLSETSAGDGSVPKGSVQLGLDGKIYVARFGQTSLGVINFPNLAGNACQYVSNGQSIGTATCGYGLPNFAGSYFEKRNQLLNFNSNSATGCRVVNFTSPTACAGSGYTITGTQWDFGDPASGSTNTATLSNPSHTFSAPGTYTTQLIVFYDCGKSDTILKTIPVTSPTLSISSPPFNCGPASATVTTFGGTGSYSYTWSPSSQTTSIANNLSTATYTVFMKDTGGGCSATQTANINATILNASVSASPALCYGSATGHATVTVLGGPGNYTYTWSPGTQTLQTALNLSAGVYTVLAYDPMSQCSISKTLQINQPQVLTASIVALTSSVCVGNSIVVYAGPAGGTSAYTYLWSNSHSGPADTLHETIGGTYVYSLNIQDANLCSAIASISLNFVANPVLSAPSISVCPQTITTLSVSGATSYTWLPGGFSGSSFTSVPTSNIVYTVTGESLGCSSTKTTSIVVFPNPTLSLSNNSPFCVGQTLQLQANTNGISYSWSGPSGFTSNIQNPLLVTSSVNSAGTYSLFIVSVNSCSVAASTTVTLFALPSLSVTGNTTICAKNQTTLTALGANSYTWNSAFLNSSLAVSPSVSTVYTLSGSSASTGCTATTTVFVTVLKCTGLDALDKTQEEFRVYPNPSHGLINLETFAPIRVRIYSELGILVFENNMETGIYSIDLSMLANGVYFLKAENTTTSQNIRILKLD